MKPLRPGIRNALGIAFSVLLLSGQDGRAQGWYLYGDIGPNIIPDTDVTLEFSSLGAGDTEIEFDPGLRFNFGVGYRFNEDWSAGFETGYIFNSVDNVGGVSFSDYDLDYYQLPFLGVVTYEYHNDTRFTPFITGGMGFVVGILQTYDDDDYYYYDDYESDASAAFGYQLGAGVDFAITDNIALGLTYKFLGTTDQDFDDDFIGSVEMDDTWNHLVAFTFKARF